MRPEEKYGECTEQGCENIIGEIFNLDDDVTIGEMKKFLRKRAEEAKNNRTKAFVEIVSLLKGRCFKFKYTDQVSYIKIDTVEPLEEYGTNDAKFTGETIILYKGQVRHEILKDKKYSNYFPSEETEETSVKEFNDVKEKLTKLIKNLQ